jgi:hypothetical protein
MEECGRLEIRQTHSISNCWELDSCGGQSQGEKVLGRTTDGQK